MILTGRLPSSKIMRFSIQNKVDKIPNKSIYLFEFKKFIRDYAKLVIIKVSLNKLFERAEPQFLYLLTTNKITLKILLLCKMFIKIFLKRCTIY